MRALFAGLRSLAAGLAVVGTVFGSVAQARPSVGRAGGGGGRAAHARPHAPAARPQMPAARPNMPAARPQGPVARPQMPAARPRTPQVQNFQRPSMGAAQRPNIARPSLPNAGAVQRPAPPAAAVRPGLGGIQPGGGGVGPGVASRPGGGFSTRPAPMPAPAPGGVAGPMTRPAGPMNRPAGPVTRPGLGAVNRPAFPQGGVGGPGLNRPAPAPGNLAGGNRPGPGGDRPGLGGDRPGLGVNRPTTLPGTLGPGDRPGIGGNRPTTLPGDLGTINRPGQGINRPGIGGDRPGLGGNRPGIGGNRPTTLPGDLGAFNRPGGGNRPGWEGNRPGIGGNRPGAGWNRPGNGNTFWNSGNWNGNTFNNNNFNNVNVGGGWGYPGWNGGWANNWNYGHVNPHYGGWYNSCWTGNWWAPVAVGAATWGAVSLASNAWGFGYGTPYVNPYYSAVPATVVAASPYDYSQPIAVASYAPDASATVTAVPTVGQPVAQPPARDEVNAAVDDGLARFKAGDYAGALTAFDLGVKQAPGDTVIHELRALALFALGRYGEAAAALNVVLASAPGMDWTTVSNVYESVDAYTAQLRKLEAACRANPDDAAPHFVLAYHYLVAGHGEAARKPLEVVVAKQPKDEVAKRLLASLQPPPAEAEPKPAANAGESAPPAAPETDLVGTWKATAGKDTIVLSIGADSTFTWKATPDGRPAVELSGTIETAADAIALVTEKAGTMAGKVAAKGADAFEFSLPGAPADAKPLLFERQKQP
ncbi:MAG: tetratricopeptide repeat protein [Planctomycetia bacterium]